MKSGNLNILETSGSLQACNGTALPSFFLLDEVGGQRHAPAAVPPKKKLGVQEVGLAPGPVWTGAEYIATTGIRSPEHPARNESLYRLRYTDPQLLNYKQDFVNNL
jgi:hypothetical protein